MCAEATTDVFALPTDVLIFLGSQATLSQFLSYATSDLGSHASLGIVFTAQALAPVVFRPLIVKVPLSLAC